MEAFEFGEVFNLAFDILIFLFLVVYSAVEASPRRFFLLPLFFLLLSHGFTVLEGFFLPRVSDFLEHFFFLISTIVLAVALRRFFMETE